MSLEQTIDNLQIRNANMVTFVGTSNTMVDTTTGRIQTKGIQHNSNVITDVSGPHGRIGPTLKKYPEIAFAEGKFDSNPTTNMYVQAGYTVSASGKFDENFTVWSLFDESEAGEGSGGCWIDSPNTTYAKEANDAYGGLVGNVLSTVHTTNTLKLASNTPVGAWFTIELPNSIKLDNIQMRPRSASVNIANQSFPKEFGIWGYDGNVWTLIKSVTGHQANYQTIYEPKYTKTNVNATTPYKKYGFVITRTNAVGGSNASDRNFVAIGALKLYGYEEDPPAGDHSVDTTFKSRFNNPQTTGVQVLVDGATGVGTNQISGDPDPSGNQSTYVTDGKYWTLNGTLTSNLAVEANTFLEGDQPHSVSVWFNSSNLEANVSNTCVFSIASEEKLDSQNLDLQSNTWHNLTYAYQGEGGSRVTYLDGRKVSEDQAEDTFGDYPPFAMTGYSQGGYVVSASSENSSFPAHEAFKDFPQSQNERWQTNRAYTSAGLPHTDSPTTLTYKGEWIQLEQPYKLKINYLKMQAHSQVQHQPENWVILGSNDGTIWEFIKERLDASSFNVDSNGYHINTDVIDSPKFYKYHRIVITKSGATAGTEQPIVVGISLYGHRENDLVRLPDPTNVLEYPHIAVGADIRDQPAKRGYVVTNGISLHSGRTGARAFDDQPTGDGWETANSSYNLNSSGIAQTNTATFGAYTGHWVKLKLPHKIVVSGIDINAYWNSNSQADDRRPDAGAFLGSNDDSSWNLIHAFGSGTLNWSIVSGHSTTYETHISSMSASNTNAYKYIVFVITNKTHGGSPTVTTTKTSIRRLRYYGTGVESIPIQIGGGNIDKVANFRVYDRFIEEDQVNEIWNAQKEEFGRAKPQMVLQQGKLGIGTDAPQGSLSVADEPHNVEEFPPRAMTAFETYMEGHGVFKVSVSSYESTNRIGWRAFDKLRHPEPAGWGTNGGYTWNTGVYHGSAQLYSGGPLGEWIQLESPYGITVSHIIIDIFQVGNRGPQGIQIVGSNNGVDWYVLVDNESPTYTGWPTYESGSARVNVNSTTAYKYHAMIARSKTFGKPGNDSGNNMLLIRHLKFFGTREQGQSILHDGQLTLTKSLNVPRIGPPLDADDTPRRDRLVVEYNTSTNPTFEGAVRDTSGRGLDGIMHTATYDATGKEIKSNGNIGTSNSGPAGTTSNANYNDYGSFETVLPPLQGNPVFTVSGWFKQNTIANLQIPWLIGKNVRVTESPGSGQNTKMSWFGVESNGRPRIAIGGGGNLELYYTTGSIQAGKWHHMVLTVQPSGTSTVAGDVTFYLDGALQSTSSTSGSSGVIDLGGGAPPRMHWFWQESTTVYYDGSASNLKIHECALTAQEVKTLYDMGRCDEGHHVVNFSKTRVGIGLGDGEAPRGALDVSGGTSRGLFTINQTDGQWYNGTALRFLQYGTNDSRWDIGIVSATDDNFAFAYNGSSRGYFRWNGNNTVQNFTGQHRTFIKDAPFSQASNLEGLIVSSDQNKYIKMSNGIEAGSNAITMNESLPIVSLSNVVTDKKCFGVISASEDPEERSDAFGNFVSVTEKEKGDTRVYINSVGEGAIWVVNTNGSLESGDYITTSNVAGYGQKQDDDILHNYTVAKITMDCDFEPATQPVQVIKKDEEGENILDEHDQIQWEDHLTNTEKAYKVRYLTADGTQTDEANAVHIAAFVGCTYHCG